MGQKKKAFVTGVVQRKTFPAIMYGLDGIMQLFDVSKSTAMRYKNGFLKEAVTQRGNVIMIDVRKALECFGVAEAEQLVE